MAEELSLKPMTELLGLARSVALTICISVSGAGCPSSTSCAPKNQCRLRARMRAMWRQISHAVRSTHSAAYFGIGLQADGWPW